MTLVPSLNAKFGQRFPTTGFKVGIAASRLLGKRVGVRGTNEPVWAGRAVNYAAKLAQEVDRHEILATKPVFDHFQNNDYVMLSCGCVNGTMGNAPSSLWTRSRSMKLPDSESAVYSLRSPWCDTHGDEFCDAICSGQQERALPTAAS